MKIYNIYRKSYCYNNKHQNKLYMLEDNWNRNFLTYNMRQDTFVRILDRLCGNTVFQGTAPHTVELAEKRIKKLLCNYATEYYTSFTRGIIQNRLPSKHELVSRFTDELKSHISFYDRYDGLLKIKDNWADALGKPKCSPNVKKIENVPRFSAYHVDKTKYIKECLQTCKSFIIECLAIYHLNTEHTCPECNGRNCISWSGGSGHTHSSSFRDGICLRCLDNNKITIFEVKSRWEKCVRQQDRIYAGNYISLTSLFSLNANIYMVVVSRDTGNVRMGKATFGYMRIREKFLYALQENENWGSPSSYVICEGGIYVIGNIKNLLSLYNSNYIEDVKSKSFLNITDLVKNKKITN